ncbi:MAG: DUF1805 domain-containing protein [Candidatus Omnitrophica bacterium]|nr:DUF1805 domain-containing protein [Candidatus Omnitrophota bacterium]
MKVLQTQDIKVGKKSILCLSLKLNKKFLIVLRGDKGYVMCGYLSMKVANKFADSAVKVKGVSTIKDALDAKVYSLSQEAKKIGIKRNQRIKDVIKIIA